MIEYRQDPVVLIKKTKDKKTKEKKKRHISIDNLLNLLGLLLWNCEMTW